jgi:hypothetical protein
MTENLVSKNLEPLVIALDENESRDINFLINRH